jgi:hypothetical protein
MEPSGIGRRPVLPTTEDKTLGTGSSPSAPPLAKATMSQANKAMMPAQSPLPATAPASQTKDTKIEWNKADAKLASTKDNANASWKVSEGGKTVWVKAVKGDSGDRVATADKAASAFGLQTPQSRSVPVGSKEGKEIAALVGKAPVDYGKGTERTAKAQMEGVTHYVIGQDIDGKAFKSLSKEEQKAALTDPGFLKDFGKMVAVDHLVLGNADRVTSWSPNDKPWSTNTGNFLVTKKPEGGYGLAAIDNELVAPDNAVVNAPHQNLAQQFADDAVAKGIQGKQEIQTASKDSGKAIGLSLNKEMFVDDDVMAATGLGSGSLPNTKKVLENPSAAMQKALSEVADASGLSLSREELAKASGFATEGFKQVQQSLPEKTPKVMGEVAKTPASPVVNSHAFAAKLASNQLARSVPHPDLPVDSPAKNGVLRNPRPTVPIQPSQLAEFANVKGAEVEQASKWGSELSAPDLHASKTATAKKLTAAIKEETAKLDQYIQGFDGKGVAHEQKQVLNSTGYLPEMKSNFNRFQGQSKSFNDPALMQALKGMEDKIQLLDKLMQPATGLSKPGEKP